MMMMRRRRRRRMSLADSSYIVMMITVMIVCHDDGDVFQRGLKLIPLPEEQPNLGKPRELRRFRPLELKLIILPRKTSMHCIFTIQSGAKTALCHRLS